MGARLRANAPSLIASAVAIAVMAWLGLYGFAWTDYETEAAPPFLALVQGHIGRFVHLLPAYGGSLELRAPFALLPGLFGGGQLAVFRLVALPCLLAGAIFGVWLVSQMRADAHSRLSRAVALGLCVANPITLRALEIGHPEELLGGVLCVAAVFVAARGRPVSTGLLLGLAIANKQWALLAVGPVVLAFPSSTGLRLRLRAMVVAGVVAAIFLVPMLILTTGGLATGARGVTQTGAIFHPEQVFWFAGQTGHSVKTEYGQITAGYRMPPVWIAGLAHPLIVALALPLTLLCLRRRPRRRLGDAMLLLALLFLLRCVLDPWDAVYYPLPFVLALLSWETATRRAPPLYSLTASVAVWAIWVSLPMHFTTDIIATVSMALALPSAVVISRTLYRRREQPGAQVAAGPAAPRGTAIATRLAVPS